MIKKVAKLQKKLLIISSIILQGFAVKAQLLSKQDSINFKTDLEKVLKKYGLKSALYSINIQSNDQRGGQTAFTITNNNYITNNYGITNRVLSELDVAKLLYRIDTIIKTNKLPKNIEIKICINSGNDENMAYAKDIFKRLKQNGYNASNSLGIVMGTSNFNILYIKSDNQIMIDVGLASANARP